MAERGAASLGIGRRFDGGRGRKWRLGARNWCWRGRHWVTQADIAARGSHQTRTPPSISGNQKDPLPEEGLLGWGLIMPVATSKGVREEGGGRGGGWRVGGEPEKAAASEGYPIGGLRGEMKVGATSMGTKKPRWRKVFKRCNAT